MRQKHQVRIIKLGQRERAERSEPASTEERPESSEREIKTVVSDWVREHRERTDEYRRTFADLLRRVGFNPVSATKRP